MSRRRTAPLPPRDRLPPLSLPPRPRAPKHDGMDLVYFLLTVTAIAFVLSVMAYYNIRME